MSLSTDLALEAARTFGDFGSLFTLENGVLVVAVFNVVVNSIVFVALLIGSAVGIFGDGRIGCDGPSYTQNQYGCLRVSPGEAIMFGALGTAATVPFIYLNARLYTAVKEKDDDMVYLWMKITAAFTVIKTVGSLSTSYLVPDLLQLWLVYAYQQSQEMAKQRAKMLPPIPKPSNQTMSTR